MSRKKLLTGLVLGGLAAAMFATQAEAVPSFARQTGLACAACHTVFPELTPFGRSFKLNGYTLTGIKQVSAKDTKAAAGLGIDQIPPISMMLQITAINQNTATSGAGNTTQVAFPDQLSLFWAGRISPHMGSFVQFTMAPGDGPGFGPDNSDIRYANTSGAIHYGIDLNNNPTVGDLWNSTPAWGYPFTGGAGVAQSLLGGYLPQTVAGLGAYADWGNGLYTDFHLYKDIGNDIAGPVNDVDPNIQGAMAVSGLAPYWRIAYHTTMGNNELMVGTYGMVTKLVDGSSPATYGGPSDKYTDVAIDTQYEHNFANSNNMLSIHARYTHEKQTLGYTASSLSTLTGLNVPSFSPTLKTLRVDGTYHWGYHTTASLAYNNTKLDGVTPAALTAFAADGASASSGMGDDTAWTAQVSYLPWENTKFTLQYVKYTKFDGATGDAASQNNMTLAQAWLMW